MCISFTNQIATVFYINNFTDICIKERNYLIVAVSYYNWEKIDNRVVRVLCENFGLWFSLIERTIAFDVIDIKLISRRIILPLFWYHCDNAINRLSSFKFQNCTMAFMHSDKSPTDKKMSIFLSRAILPKPSPYQAKFIARHCLPPLV